MNVCLNEWKSKRNFWISRLNSDFCLLLNNPATSNSLKQSPYWETKSFSPCQGILRIVWNLKSLYRVHERPPSVISRAGSIHSTPFPLISIRYILISFSHLGVGLGILDQRHIRIICATYLDTTNVCNERVTWLIKKWHFGLLVKIWMRMLLSI